MGAWQLCGVAPLLLRNKLLGFVGKEQAVKKPKAPRNKKKKTKISGTSASVRKLNGVAEKFVKKQKKKKHKIADIRRKILIFRDYLNLCPCIPSATINEMLISTMKDIHRLYPNTRLDTAISDLEEAPYFKILRSFCDVLKNLGDLWTNNGEWMVKCKYSDKLSQDQLEQLAQAMLEDMNKLAGERMFDMMDEDDHTSECSHPENAFGRTPSGTYSEGKACHSSSPATPTSVLPQMSRTSSKRSYSPPLVVPLSVQSMKKLSPIDIKRLSLHIFSHAEASHEDEDRNNIQQVETSPESMEKPETEKTDESSPELKDKPEEKTEGSDESNYHASEMLEDTLDRYSDVISTSVTPRKESTDVVPHSGEKSKSSTPDRAGIDVIPHSKVKSKSGTPEKEGIDVVPQGHVNSKSGPSKRQVIDVVPPPAWLHKLKPNVSAKENPLPILPPKSDVLSAPQTMLSRPKGPPSPPTPPPPPQTTVTKKITTVGSPPPTSKPVASPTKISAKSAPPPPPPFSPIKGSPPPPAPLSPIKCASSPPPPPPSGIKSAPPTPLLSPIKGAPPPPPPSPIKGAPPPPPPSPIKGAPPPPPGLGNKQLGKTASRLRRSAEMAKLYRSLKGKVEGSTLETKSARPGKVSAAAPGGKQGMADALAEMTKRSAYFLQIEEDVKNHEKSIMQLKKSINSFESSNMDELYTFHKYVESILEKLSDETQVLARFEDFPTRKLETIRMASALYSKLVSTSKALKDWKIESPVGKVLDKLENYFSKVKQDVDALERTKAEEMKKFKNYKITFDFSILVEIKEHMVDVSSSCMELALKEKRESTAAETTALSPTAEQQKKGSAKVLWKAFQFAYRVYTFAGGHDDRADQLTREIAKEIETDPEH